MQSDIFDYEMEEFELLNSEQDPYFIFISDGTFYALKADTVSEILEYQNVTQVPLLNSYVWGVMNVRGDIVPVIDFNDRVLRKKTQITHKTSLVTVKTFQDNSEIRIALVVDEIFEVDGLDDETIAEVPLFGTKIEPKFIQNIAKYNNKEILILNLDEILSLSQISLLADQSQSNACYNRVVRKQNILDYDDDNDDFETEIIDSHNEHEINQYLIFYGPNNQLYGQNVSKIDEVLMLQELDVQQSFDQSVIVGVVNIRGEMMTLVNFDKWLGIEDTHSIDYQEVIVSNYGKYKFGILIRRSEFITAIDTARMTKSSDADPKSTFIAKVTVDNNQAMCTIIDSDKLTLSIFESQREQIENDLSLINDIIQSDKIMFFADDSSLVRNLMVKSCAKMNLKCKVFENAYEMLEGINKTDTDQIGIIVTDLEMPVMDGKELIKHLRMDSIYNHIPIVVYTNMANSVLADELLQLGATRVQTKIDVESLNAIIKELML